MVILVNVILALAAATREVPVINEMLHQCLRLRFHVKAVGRVDAIMRASTVNELT